MAKGWMSQALRPSCCAGRICRLVPIGLPLLIQRQPLAQRLGKLGRGNDDCLLLKMNRFIEIAGTGVRSGQRLEDKAVVGWR